MVKKFFTILILTSSLFMPIFGVTVTIPGDGGSYNSKNSDYNIGEGGAANIVIGGKYSDENSQKQIYGAINYVNSYLWWAFGAVCTGAVIYGGYRLITSNGDKKAMKEAIRTLVGSAIGVAIAMLSYTLVTLLANLNP